MDISLHYSSLFAFFGSCASATFFLQGFKLFSSPPPRSTTEAPSQLPREQRGTSRVWVDVVSTTQVDSPDCRVGPVLVVVELKQEEEEEEARVRRWDGC